MELYPQDYCEIVTDITNPTCLEMSIAEIWAAQGFSSQQAWDNIHKLTQEDIIEGVNTKTFSEIFLFDKNFTSYLGGVDRDSEGRIIGAKATTIHFYGQIQLDKITEEDKKSNSLGSPVI